MTAFFASAAEIEVAFGASEGGSGYAALDHCRPNQPLRLNEMNVALPREGSPIGSGPLAGLMLAALQRLCDPWDKNALRFLERYFRFLEQQLDMNKERVAQHLAPFGGLYRPEHVLFSAPAPLPRARIRLGGLQDIHLPFLFWQGAMPVAVFLQPLRVTPKRARADAERLDQAGIRHISLAATDMQDDETLFNTVLGAPVMDFFESEPVPNGPRSRSFVPF
ncbi:hypothetical protein FPY71_13750 [Aureimonas fodinaquatilis]|uniref:Uncharacterized protein n=1 Tax=Aureimonas fodinaquatilis TaxID=2565783 RepID=A0A5B0DSZ3_9HYPH|nr:hypothetical protein [Aureimonas fodinaquatilis]KAA0969586.1 hypothetical protein FPY71_13750 [Aureimonas fodinaquatilis]